MMSLLIIIGLFSTPLLSAENKGHKSIGTVSAEVYSPASPKPKSEEYFLEDKDADSKILLSCQSFLVNRDFVREKTISNALFKAKFEPYKEEDCSGLKYKISYEEFKFEGQFCTETKTTEKFFLEGVEAFRNKELLEEFNSNKDSFWASYKSKSSVHLNVCLYKDKSFDNQKNLCAKGLPLKTISLAFSQFTINALNLNQVIPLDTQTACQK